jgi:NitT/TauT family transport system ATP-binding protein
MAEQEEKGSEIQEVQFTNTPLPDMIELRNISQVYDGNKTVIKGCNLLIEDKPGQGEFVVILGKSGCVDKETEFFNGHSWVPISDYKTGDKVLQYCEDGTATLVDPYQYVKEPVDFFYSFSTKYGLDQRLSPEHTVVYVNHRRPSKILKITAEELYNNHMANVNGASCRFITTFKYASGVGIGLTDAEIRVTVAAIADGHYNSNTNHCIFRFKKERKVLRLVQLLTDAGIEYNKRPVDKKGYTVITCYTPMHDKVFNSLWYQCSQEQLIIITEEALHWDGSVSKNRRYVSTTVKENADFLQFAYSGTGTRTSISVNDRVGESHVGTPYIRKSIEYKVVLAGNNLSSILNSKDTAKVPISKVPAEDGFKYCFTVPSGMLVLRRGTKIFITGNCGKSTLLRYIAGLQQPTTGEVLLNGKLRTSKDAIGMVFQQYSSFPWLTVLENVELGMKYQGVNPKERKEKAMSLIEKVGLVGNENKYAQYPTLSGGQLQRVAIARSLAANPKVLLLDEPFGALDIHTRLKMQEMLHSVWHEFQGTMILVTHDISEAVFLGDDVYVMGKNPGNIKKHVRIPFSLNRTRDLKRAPEFNKMVYDLEDIMMAK